MTKSHRDASGQSHRDNLSRYESHRDGQRRIYTPVRPSRCESAESGLICPDTLSRCEPPSDAGWEWYWDNLHDADREYLTTPRDYPTPCPWCGGRLIHTEACRELRASWWPVMPFGRHKGTPLPLVPRRYLQWLVRRKNIDNGLREAATQCLTDQRGGGGAPW